MLGAETLQPRCLPGWVAEVNPPKAFLRFEVVVIDRTTPVLRAAHTARERRSSIAHDVAPNDQRRLFQSEARDLRDRNFKAQENAFCRTDRRGGITSAD